MLNNLSIKSRMIFVIGFLSALLVGIGIMGLTSLNSTNAALKTVYEDRVVALGDLERISALINRNQILVAESVSGQLSEFPEEVALVDKRVVEMKDTVKQIDALWKAYLAAKLTPEEIKLAKEFDATRKQYGSTGLMPAIAALSAHDFQQAGEILQGAMKETYPPVRGNAEALIKLQLTVAKGEFEAAQSRFIWVRNISTAVIVFGVLFAAVIGFWLIRAITMPLNEAVRRLSQLCRQRIFQPETRGRPAIQVLGALESAGLDFDALWVMGMNDDLWPPPPRPNPFLPAELLRAAGAAHASAEVELDFAQRVHARLALAAPAVVFSYAQADGNRLLRPSPLIAGMARAAAAPVAVATLARQLAAESPAALDQVADATAPPVAEGAKVSGGSWLVRAQAICPAWAYYQYRLGGEAMDEPVEGLDPAARGTLVHEALEAFWNAVRTSTALAALAEAGRRQAVAEAVAAALRNFEQDRHITLPARFRELEAARLQKLLDVWLAVEEKRGLPFEVIACEQAAEVEIEEIKVKMIVDRIDRLVDGRQIIIDYKTGAAIDTRNWAEQRISEPQLPIYAALVNDEVAAVVFAKVLLDKPGFAGVADARDILPGVQGIGDDKQKVFDPAEFPDWIAVVTHWRERLHAVAGEVKAGQAAVAFADEKDLQYCEVLPLLRLPERRRLLAESFERDAAASRINP